MPASWRWSMSASSSIAGEVHAILGENGAGKSTLMNIISGAIQPDVGEIHFGERRIATMSPQVAAALGVAISFQHPAVLDDLSVLENFQVALPASLFEGKSARDLARKALDAVGLHAPLRARADTLRWRRSIFWKSARRSPSSRRC